MESKLDRTTASVQAEISGIQSLKPDAVRSLWRKTFQREAPKALTRDLLLRALCWHIQEQAFGGHDRGHLQILASYGKRRPDFHKGRRLKPGTEIVREYQGERHTVLVTAEGFRWRDSDYPSLTAIAQTITGTNWNGPRFFGLRTPSTGTAPAVPRDQRVSRAGSRQASRAAERGHL